MGEKTATALEKICMISLISCSNVATYLMQLESINTRTDIFH